MSGLEILAYDDSPLGPLCLRRREVLGQPGVSVTEVTLNHEFLMSSLYTDSERTLADTAIDRCEGRDLRVLVGGLGLGYTAEAALTNDRVARVEVVEWLPQVIGWLDAGLVPLASELRRHAASGRLVVTEGDAYERVTANPNPTECFDAILIDIDHSPDDRLGDASASFYTVEGLRAARRHLTPGGVLAVWSYAESTPFSTALREVFSDVEVVPVSYDNELIGQRCTDWLFFAVAD